MTRLTRALIPALAAALVVGWNLPAFADPPDWAPAYGERDHDEDRRDEGDDEGRDRREHGHPHYGEYREYQGRHAYYGYGGDDWDDDYGVVRGGRCNTDAVLGVTGAVAGAIIGNRTAAPQNRGIATVFGAIAGGIIGSAVGDAIDDGDRACIGQSLELAQIGRPVVWINPHSRVAWRLVPVRNISRQCREFDLRRRFNGRNGHKRVIACRRARGDWMFR